jgi:alpha-N-arabinofuranosidase
VAEGVYLLGAERNGDRIWGATFAPLFQNLNSYQWAVS